jgi:hypothetical protein
MCHEQQQKKWDRIWQGALKLSMSLCHTTLVSSHTAPPYYKVPQTRCQKPDREITPLRLFANIAMFSYVTSLFCTIAAQVQHRKTRPEWASRARANTTIWPAELLLRQARSRDRYNDRRRLLNPMYVLKHIYLLSELSAPWSRERYDRLSCCYGRRAPVIDTTWRRLLTPRYVLFHE